MNFLNYGEPEFSKVISENISKIPQATSFYTPLLREFQHHYLGPKLVKDLSFFAYLDAKTVAGYVPLYLCKVDDQLEFSYGGEFLRAPLICVPETSRLRLGVEEEIYQRVENLAKEYQAKIHKAAIEPFGCITGHTYCNYLRNYNYQDQSTSTQMIDLKQSDENLWLGLRKSYRPLINKAQKKYKSVIVDEQSWKREYCEKYRMLHYAAAGRVTRPLATFEKMYEMIKTGQAFLVGITTQDDDWLGAFMFFRFNGHTYYSSGALDPKADMKDGIGHWGVWRAITHSKARGDSFFEVGWQPFPDEEDFNEKINNIALFKRGFGGVRVSWFRGVKKFSD